MTRFAAILIAIAALLCVIHGSARAADAPQSPSSLSSPDAHNQLRQILDQAPYNVWRLRQKGQSPAGQTMLNRLGQGISDALRRFWDWLFPQRKSAGISSGSHTSVLPTVLESFAWLIVSAAVIFIGVLIIKSIRGAGITPATARILSREQIQDALNSGDALALNANEWLDQAQRLALEKNFRAVYRAMYLALLSGLHTAGKIDHSRNRTNWTYVQHYRGPADERLVFGDLTDLFDRVWYGCRDDANPDLARLQSSVASLIKPGGRA